MPEKRTLLEKIEGPIRDLLKDPLQGTPSGKILRLLERRHLRYLDLIPRESLEEKLIHLVLEGQGPWQEVGAVFDQLLGDISRYGTDGVRVVVFGGGTGLSSILGGDTALPSWPQSPFGGLKRIFPDISVGVCMTDDGKSSGILLRSLRCVALGDLRRAILSSITPRRILFLDRTLQLDKMETVAACLQRIINYRFGKHPNPFYLKKPTALLAPSLRQIMPGVIGGYLDSLGAHLMQDPFLKDIPLEGQCLGNLLIAAAIYRERIPGRNTSSGKKETRPPSPSHREIEKGIQGFAAAIGAGRDTLFPACTTQGELQVLYRHGVLSAGEEKSSIRHSSFPVDRVWVHFVGEPRTSPRLLRRIEEADLIVFAPGSLYTSIVPILQVPAVSETIRRNKKAMKVLGVNFWAQRGETDISLRRLGKEYYVSDLIEAYHRNIPGGVGGLFETMVVTDLRSIPGDILRNYALEGKVPIYLDKEPVRAMGFEPVEAALFSEQKLRNERVIQHDPEKFAKVLKTLCYLRRNARRPEIALSLSTSAFRSDVSFPRKGYLCDHWKGVGDIVARLDCPHPGLKDLFQLVLWDNREILLDHLENICGIQVIRPKQWMRSTEWDNILGYYEPADGYLKIHEQLVKGPQERLIEDLLIALGESLLGDYCRQKRVREIREDKQLLGKVFELDLNPPEKRSTFLEDTQLREYLRLAQLRPVPLNPYRFCMLINHNEAFTPPGLLFGLLYAWYVNNRFGGIVDYEASLLRWKISELIPKSSMERERMEERIAFFRRFVFRQNTALSADTIAQPSR